MKDATDQSEQRAAPFSPTGAVPAGVEQFVAKIVMGLEDQERALLVNGRDTWSTVAVARLGLGSIRMSDGPAGVRGTAWDERRTAVSFPCGAAMGATFDAELLHRVGEALAAEALAQGVHVVLGPTINLQRYSRAGRHFEYLAADPYLTAVLGTAYVRGLQRHGVAATPKHFVANDSETERHTVSIDIGQRSLRESYLLPFEAVVRDGGAWALMAAYSSIDGTPMTANDTFLTGILIDEWGFDGVTMSDWGAVYDCIGSARAGLHLAMPGPDGQFGQPLRDALANGEISPSTLDDKVGRIARLAARVGAGPWPPAQTPAVDAAAIAFDAAARSIVLLDDQGTLPLKPATLSRVAVIGPNAIDAYTQGGGSAHVNSGPILGPAAALADRLGDDVEVVTELGCDHRIFLPELGSEVTMTDPLTGEPGLRLEYLDAAGAVRHSERRSGARLVWFGELPAGLGKEEVPDIRLTAHVVAAEAGPHEIGVAALTSQRLWVDGQLVVDVSREGLDFSDEFHRPAEHRVVVEAPAAGHRFELRIEQALYNERTMGVCFIGMRPEPPSVEQRLDAAATMAASADLVVLVVGTNDEVETEGLDRSSQSLPGVQDELVRRVCAANRRTIVVVNAGSPVAMPWRSLPAAIVVNWFGGQWTGPALAAVLCGDREPVGRLPMPWPANEATLLDPTPVGGHLDYGEEPVAFASGPHQLFPFGAGRGYTTWSCVAAVTEPAVADGGPGRCAFGEGPGIDLVVRVANTGSRPGSTVVQVYAGRRGAGRRLAGFATATANAGDNTDVRVHVPRRLLQRWDVDTTTWTFDPDITELIVGFDADAALETGSGISVPIGAVAGVLGLP